MRFREDAVQVPWSETFGAPADEVADHAFRDAEAEEDPGVERILRLREASRALHREMGPA